MKTMLQQIKPSSDYEAKFFIASVACFLTLGTPLTKRSVYLLEMQKTNTEFKNLVHKHFNNYVDKQFITGPLINMIDHFLGITST